MRFLLALALSILITSTSTASPADFEVAAKIDESTLSSDFYQQAGRFYVNATVKNISTSPKNMIVWTNQTWSWVTDDGRVSTSQEAAKNSPSVITLAPLETYQETLEMATDPQGKKPITFRLGFLPTASLPVTNYQDPQLIWTMPDDFGALKDRPRTSRRMLSALPIELIHEHSPAWKNAAHFLAQPMIERYS